MTAFFDTHAILGILQGESAYLSLRGRSGLTHETNLLEAMVKLIRHGDPTPWERVQSLGLGMVAADRLDLVVAAHLKASKEMRARQLSYVDALGYAISRRLELPFVTGDQGFRGLEGVEFVTTGTRLGSRS